MKKLLLLLFLMLVSLGSYGEKVLYCSDNLATGFFKENGHWSSGDFTLKKWTIKFNQDYSLLSGLKGGRDWNCFNSYGNTDYNSIACVSAWENGGAFSYHKKNKRYLYISSITDGYIDTYVEPQGTDILRAGSCVDFN